MKHSKNFQKAALALSLIALFCMEALQAQDTLSTAAPLTTDHESPAKSFDQFRLSLNGGYSYRINKIHEDFQGESREYMQGLKSGTAFSAEGIYYFRENVGFGCKYALHRASNSAYLIMPASSGYDPLRVSDDISITYIGPVLGTRFFDKTGRNVLILQYGLGYMGFKNNSRIPSRLRITGGTFGSCYDLGYEVQLAKGLALGVQVSYLSGILTRMKYDDGHSTETRKLERENYEGLSRLDLMAGLRISL